jgi:hypothetical protein
MRRTTEAGVDDVSVMSRCETPCSLISCAQTLVRLRCDDLRGGTATGRSSLEALGGRDGNEVEIGDEAPKPTANHLAAALD